MKRAYGKYIAGLLLFVSVLDLTGLKNAAIQLVVSFLMVAVFVLAGHPLTMPAGSSQWFCILFLGIVNTGIGCYLYFQILQNFRSLRFPSSATSNLCQRSYFPFCCCTSPFLCRRPSVQH